MMPANLLVHEKSPYLLQHARNPVHWHPWNEEAFERAESEDKPIFLSIGYATCHWCHVMEKESFEDDEAADLLNEIFVCIKVDREERPDIDSVYMTACQMLTGRGGWPLTIFMTPDRRPFFAATYIPKIGHFGQGGLMEICREIRQLWGTDRDRILHSARSLTAQLSRAFHFSGGSRLKADILEKGAAEIRSAYDAEHGGFGPAPKFPTPHRMMFLLRHFRFTGKREGLEMTEKTLTAMRLGGLWDHVGFGFHRYSTDARWRVPHFEKMLYDQALISIAALETFQAGGNDFFARMAGEIFTYVREEMTAPEGGFYSARDADSEGKEGKFYVWTPESFRSVLGKEADFWEPFFHLHPEGNFTDETTRRKNGTNILYLSRPLSWWAEKNGMEPGHLRKRWEAARIRLREHREKRPHPMKDDKILTDWNGLMIAAFALGGRILNRRNLTETAVSAARFILKVMKDEKGRLLHRFRDGEAAVSAHADDYEFLIWGLLELYSADFDPAWLSAAAALQERMDEAFRDEERGGFFLSTEKTGELPIRPKEIYDGATPSANSAALCNLLRLFQFTGHPKWEQRALELMETFSGTVAGQPSAFTHFLTGAGLHFRPRGEIVISGASSHSITQEMIEAVNRIFAPEFVTLLKTPANAEALAKIAPFTDRIPVHPDRSAAYICANRTCQAPIFDVETLKQTLNQMNRLRSSESGSAFGKPGCEEVQ